MDKKQLDEELEKRLTSRGLLKYAWDYYQAFEDQHSKYLKALDMYEVKYYLLCHSLELAMKAYLREKGFTRKQLLDLGHDLEKLIQAMHNAGVILDVSSIERTVTLSDYYKTKQFEYPQTGYKELPSLENMKESVQLVLSLVDNAITKRFPKKANV